MYEHQEADCNFMLVVLVDIITQRKKCPTYYAYCCTAVVIILQESEHLL